ncbi:unnamed protein product [Polarella glacialis]|uniref:Protein kinase domain-containing protein n=1 Tax=Polarella glacialis TaxID=89957 RepID=A0A813IFV0_POLGL|nr:unnamed protein product [Polarella glacialis]
MAVGAETSPDNWLIEDDGSVELALMASAHPEISRCGDAVLECLRNANELLGQCSSWIKAGSFPEAVLGAHALVQDALDAAYRDIARLDDIDLSDLQPSWGDKESVRMARKSLIGLLEAIIERLLKLQRHLEEPVSRRKKVFAQIEKQAEAKQMAAAAPVWEQSGAVGGERSRSPRECGRMEKQTEGKNKLVAEAKEESDGSDAEEAQERRRRERETPHFQWTRGLTLGPHGRYLVRKHLGDGTFGRVLGCMDTVSKSTVAVKVVRGVKRYQEHAEAEAEVLREIMRCDPGRQSHCVQLLDEFLHPVHNYCLVFEPLDVSLRDFLGSNDDQGLLVRDVRIMAQHLLQCLTFLCAIGLTHTDLKCRNVMLRDGRSAVVPLLRRGLNAKTRSPHKCEIYVIDFGGAVFKDDRHSNRVGTRQYRCPEVVLGLQWDEKSDLWSAACILASLYTGERLFPIHDDLEHLALMERVTGCKIPSALALQASEGGGLSKVVAFEGGCLIWPGGADTEAVELVQKAKSLRELVPSQHSSFVQLLQAMLQLDPKSRASAGEAMLLSFIADEAEIPE